LPASNSSSRKASISAAFVVRALAATSFANVVNFSFLATKSVSELTSTTAALLPSAATAVTQTPSAAILSAIPIIRYSSWMC